MHLLCTYYGTLVYHTCSTADPAYTTFGLCRVCLSCLPSQVIGMLRLV
jgi:hypothetical protein